MWRYPSWPLFSWFWCKASKASAWSSPGLLGYHGMTMLYHFAVDPAPGKKWLFSCCFAPPCDAVQTFLTAKVRTPSCFYLGFSCMDNSYELSLPGLLLERHLWHHWPGPTLVLEEHVLVFMMSERYLSEFCSEFCSGFRILFSGNGLSQSYTPQALQWDEDIKKDNLILVSLLRSPVGILTYSNFNVFLVNFSKISNWSDNWIFRSCVKAIMTCMG